MKKTIVFCLTLGVVVFFLGRDLNPLDSRLFTFHDNTQAVRMQEFAFNLKSGILPPRMAPHFSFQHGFPVFNFYAPFAYWMGALFSLVGISSAISLKIVLLLGLLMSFIAFFLFASSCFGFWAGLLGGVVYSSSLWMAVEIFVRGNVGEIWFMALLPLALLVLKKSDEGSSHWLFVLSCIILSALFTVHNVLSLVSVVFIGIFMLGLTHKKKAFLSLLFGLLLGSYFLVPAAVENRLTYANEIAAKTKYADHFLCAWQLWRADKWSYGGSGIGCLNDDMSFQVGKIHLLLAGVGLVLFLMKLRKGKKKSIYLPILFLCVGFMGGFLTLEWSKPIWDLFAPFVAVFQFPWRLLSFLVFGSAFFASYIPTSIFNRNIRGIVVLILSFILLYTSGKFFSKPWKYSIDEYTAMFLTEKYSQQKAAYEIPEYFPRSGDYKIWRRYDKSQAGFVGEKITYKMNSPFYKEIIAQTATVTLPVHFFPYWEILVNGRRYNPEHFDSLGRPVLSDLASNSIVIVRYNETPVEKAANGITLISIVALLVVWANKKLWKKMNTILQ